MPVKINQLSVNGSLSPDSDMNEGESDSSISEKLLDEKIKKLKRQLDEKIDISFKQICDSTVDKIIEKIHKKSDY